MTVLFVISDKMHLKLIIVLVASVFCVGLATDCYDEVLGLCTTKGGTEGKLNSFFVMVHKKYVIHILLIFFFSIYKN